MPPKASQRKAQDRGESSSTTTHIKSETNSESAFSNSNYPASQSIENNVGTSKTQNQSLSSEPSATRSMATVRRGRGSTRASSTPTVPSRFKPKNVRRSAAELAELAHKEEIRKAAALAALAREEARIARGRGKQRGRGDMMSRGRGKPGGASSIFGTAPESLKTSSGMFSLRSGGIGGLGGSGNGSGTSSSMSKVSFKAEGSGHSGSRFPGSSVAGSGGKGEDIYFTPQYPGEDDDAIRIDIEHINLISEDEDEVAFAGSRKIVDKGKAVAKSGLRPVRLQREEHKERATVVNTAPTVNVTSPKKQQIEDKEEGLFVLDEPRSSNYNKVTETVNVESGNDVLVEPRIKQESSIEIELNLNQPQTLIPEFTETRTKHSPENNYKINNTLTAHPSGASSDKTTAPTANVGSKFHKSSERVSKKLATEPVFQTEEDRAEYERYLEDVAILSNELGCLQDSTSSKLIDAEGDENMDNTETVQEEQDKREGRLYLFQFPPVLPALYNPQSAKNIGSTVKIKQENTENNDLDRALIEDKDLASSNQKGKEKVREPDVSANSPVIKLEIEDAVFKNPREDILKGDETINEEGLIGKLIVRESGRVELSWGGTGLLLGRGVDAGFLTTGVIVDSVERGPRGGGVPEGRALGMGQIMGKFVVTPDWKNMA